MDDLILYFIGIIWLFIGVIFIFIDTDWSMAFSLTAMVCILVSVIMPMFKKKEELN